MTPPGGSRDDDADNAPRDPARPLSIDAPRREPVPRQGRSGRPGSAPDDAGDDARAGEPGHDPQLRAMRAVWLAMRDEDPPDRGLAELLAAARHQAEAMHPRPGAWQRLFAALRRPPVLALATVTVLIAGALLIGRRAAHEATPGLTTSQKDAGPQRPAEVVPGVGSPADELVPAGAYHTGQSADRGGPAPQPAVPPPAATALPSDRERVRPASPTHFAAPPQAPRSPAGSPPGEAARDDNQTTAGPVPEPAPPPADRAPAPPPSPPERVTQLGASAAVNSASTAGDSNARPAARPSRAEPETRPPVSASNEGRNDTAGGTANNTANNAANPVVNGVAAPSRRPSPAPPRPDAPGDLSQQCEAAAQRGDCATVRRLVDRITRTDRGYRARVAKDSPVGKCLAE